MTSKFASRLRALGILVILATLALAGCGGSTTAGSSSGGTLAPGDSFKLGVSLTFNNTDFWTNYISYETKFASQYKATLIGPLVANNDAAKQITDIRTLIQEGAQALIVNPVDSAAIAPALDYAASKHIPVISVDVAPSTGKVFMIVRADNVLYGQNSCKYIASHASGSGGHIAILEGDLASLNGKDRTDGCTQVIKSNYPQFKTVEYATKWDTPTAVNDAKTALSTYPDLQGIYVEWGAPEDGILAAEQAAGKFTSVGGSSHIVLVGNDGVPHEHALIRSNKLDATISQPANAYAQYAVFYARAALEGKTYSAGQSTDHKSTIVSLQGNLEDALPAPIVDKTNVGDPNLWGNAKSTS
ncbi:ABC transporter substrate-binding protein [Ktedonobacter sp. SOSP1-52]|uniref:sugar ABC transporter substrate-binding protein n=1 Tax=Ktedonobacter sp. SOSP1-52 TaxID=2778366 RepID=UPI0019168044|nr:sugar ABC transporter substrate-binding protein [Ktedonobacter sp. SOSP1-52]GHO65163.1 ABC transporter substrate-binding protein [Ktedonobacter sp. SOSP1-52]